ncbi:type II 3-dehydroquinate dehydratase [Streptomyces sp. NBC_00059]|uniref:type II 3-dehydroquinate dehydratase n=1 Tax=Streptomyces sp. NBC_00059 TaxID=2975635 RepID=UPI002254A1D0|nr:type II 3-dehydroquinate dehydratase [Streptomyces sp. NBC_00059]MCX5412884.1 type II 3-dehydroquinate dehydratase [Streptomyces sp. NBC_00059]
MPNPAAPPPGVPVLVLNGPNLNLLGLREPAVYGKDTLADVDELCRSTAAAHGLLADCRQSNHEGVLIDAVHEARTAHRGIVINPAGYSHTSVALRDALAAVELPVVEVHLSNIHRREEFRHHSHVSGVADTVICGAGAHGYAMALTHLARLLEENR